MVLLSAVGQRTHWRYALQPPTPHNLPAITALRFYAAIWVVIYHFSDHVQIESVGWSRVAHSGPLAVDFFFVLSGFILAHVYSTKAVSGRLSVSKFLARRLARIYPMHLVSTLMLVALFFLSRGMGLPLNSPDKYDFSVLPLHLMLIHAWGTTTAHAWNIPSWSISAEWFAYLLFPFAAAPILSTKREICTAALGIVFFVFVVATVHLGLGWNFTSLQRLGIVRVVPEFVLGMAIWPIWRSNWNRLVLPTFWAHAFLALIPCVAFIIPGRMVTLAILFASLPVLAVAPGKGLLSRVPQYLGHASFSLYMTHGITQTVFFNGANWLGLPHKVPGGTWILFWAGVSLSVVVSVAVYEVVEKPANRALRARIGR